MAAEPVRQPADVPRVPRCAWDWLQRSRPVVERLADVLTGQPPRAGFVEAVRRSFAADPLVRDAVHSVIAEVAFRDRVPPRRPRGASWDRGLTWWAASLVGCSPDEYTEAPPSAEQPALFDAGPGAPDQRAALVAALRDVLAHRTGDQVPASAVRALIRELEDERPAEDSAR